MMAANDSVMKMTDATKKAAVMKEMGMVKDMIAKKDEKGCMMQMEKAMGMRSDPTIATSTTLWWMSRSWAAEEKMHASNPENREIIGWEYHV